MDKTYLRYPRTGMQRHSQPCVPCRGLGKTVRQKHLDRGIGCDDLEPLWDIVIIRRRADIVQDAGHE